MEKMVTNPEYDEYIKEVIAGHEEEIESLLADTTTRLGEGRTAYVSFLNFKAKICIKIYKRPEQIIAADFYLPPAKEESFLEDLRGLDAKVRVPTVYSSFKDNDRNGHDFLMMEALPAVSVDDILQDRAKLPENFDFNSFQIDLLDFVDKMHQRGVYHRDLHEGNIMIDNETGQLYVIDFGAANTFWGQPEVGERGPYHISKDGRDIILTSDEAMVKAVVKKLKLKLTDSN